MSCHTLNGYRGIKGLLATRDSNGVASILTMLKQRTPDAPYHAFMPPLAATPVEMADLKLYLCSVTNKKMLPPPAPLASEPVSSPSPAPLATPAGKPTPVKPQPSAKPVAVVASAAIATAAPKLSAASNAVQLEMVKRSGSAKAAGSSTAPVAKS